MCLPGSLSSWHLLGGSPPRGQGLGSWAQSLSLLKTSGHQLCFRNQFPYMSDPGLGQTGDFPVFIATEPCAQQKANLVKTELLSRNGNGGPDDPHESLHQSPSSSEEPSDSLTQAPHYLSPTFPRPLFSGGARAHFKACAAKTTP